MTMTTTIASKQAGRWSKKKVRQAREVYVRQDRIVVVRAGL
jgi:hypothetical protein